MKPLNYVLLLLSLESPKPKPSINAPSREAGVWSEREEYSMSSFIGALRSSPAPVGPSGQHLPRCSGQACLWRGTEEFHFVTLTSNARGNNLVLLQN